MALHTDIPTRAQIDRLLASRSPSSVSVYLETDPASAGTAERIELKNLAAEAARQLSDLGAGHDVAEIGAAFADLADDEAFWRYQARSLAAFATPDTLTTFRLPNRLVNLVEVSDRFHLKPLLRSCWPSLRTRSACSRWWPTSSPPRWRCPTFRPARPPLSACPRSRAVLPGARSRAPKGRRSGCTSTRGRSTGRCARC